MGGANCLLNWVLYIHVHVVCKTGAREDFTHSILTSLNPIPLGQYRNHSNTIDQGLHLLRIQTQCATDFDLKH